MEEAREVYMRLGEQDWWRTLRSLATRPEDPVWHYDVAALDDLLYRELDRRLLEYSGGSFVRDGDALVRIPGRETPEAVVSIPDLSEISDAPSVRAEIDRHRHVEAAEVFSYETRAGERITGTLPEVSARLAARHGVDRLPVWRDAAMAGPFETAAEVEAASASVTTLARWERWAAGVEGRSRSEVEDSLTRRGSLRMAVQVREGDEWEVVAAGSPVTRRLDASSAEYRVAMVDDHGDVVAASKPSVFDDPRRQRHLPGPATPRLAPEPHLLPPAVSGPSRSL
ncbi:MAG: hypothetical protein QM621_08130 [Aeromicrobium sp.]|uniref:hypothetical protein n=1 Tax=Aeromicrobium sp. TaxID=1871063 RepID=UPI0039E5D273